MATEPTSPSNTDSSSSFCPTPTSTPPASPRTSPHTRIPTDTPPSPASLRAMLATPSTLIAALTSRGNCLLNAFEADTPRRRLPLFTLSGPFAGKDPSEILDVMSAEEELEHAMGDVQTCVYRLDLLAGFLEIFEDWVEWAEVDEKFACRLVEKVAGMIRNLGEMELLIDVAEEKFEEVQDGGVLLTADDDY